MEMYVHYHTASCVKEKKFEDISLTNFPKGSICKLRDGTWATLKDPNTGLTSPGGYHLNNGLSPAGQDLDIVFIEKRAPYGTSLWAWQSMMLEENIIHKNHRGPYSDCPIKDKKKFWESLRDYWLESKAKDGWMSISDYERKYGKPFYFLKKGDYVHLSEPVNGETIKRVMEITSDSIILEGCPYTFDLRGISFKNGPNIVCKVNPEDVPVKLTLDGYVRPSPYKDKEYFCLSVEDYTIFIPYEIITDEYNLKKLRNLISAQKNTK